MGAYRSCVISEEERREWRMLRSGLGPIPEDKLALCELAARQMRDRLINIPYYAERDRELGMRFWRELQAREYPVS